MKHIYILACIVSFGIYTSTYAQEQPMITDTISASSGAEEEIGLEDAIFTASTKESIYGGCSLIKESHKERKIYTNKNGYKIVTGDNDEIVTVKRYNDGSRKIKYSNDFESLKFHQELDGKMHYSYSYDNYECKKVRIRRNKNGITSVTNKSGVELDQLKGNVKTSMDTGVASCYLVR